jgi:hypothetical protein
MRRGGLLARNRAASRGSRAEGRFPLCGPSVGASAGSTVDPPRTPQALLCSGYQYRSLRYSLMMRVRQYNPNSTNTAVNTVSISMRTSILADLFAELIDQSDAHAHATDSRDIDYPACVCGARSSNGCRFKVWDFPMFVLRSLQDASCLQLVRVPCSASAFAQRTTWSTSGTLPIGSP